MHTKNKNTPIKKLWPNLTVAASIAIILGIFLYNPQKIYTSNYGEQISVTLPDGSEMILNAKSIASFDKSSWNVNREVSLKGEAFFKVKKGGKFTVVTDNGNISVLGTQFNVQSQDSFFEVTCFEGKVKVQSNTAKKILTSGKGYRTIETVFSTLDMDFSISQDGKTVNGIRIEE